MKIYKQAVTFTGALLFVILMTNPIISKCHTSVPFQEIKGWVRILETPTELEVSYSIVKCNDEVRILLSYFNETRRDQQLKYTITVKHGKKTIKQKIVKNLSAVKIVQGACESVDKEMFILLPADWDLNNIKVNAKLN